MKISGKFDVSLNPMDTYATSVDSSQLCRMSIDKQFHGYLSAESIADDFWLVL